MAEQRLIDANALVERLAYHGRTCLQIGRGDAADGLRMALFEIANTPTVDAAPVVRCKDCKMYEENPEAFTTCCRRELHYLYARPDGYCSYGERKDK